MTVENAQFVGSLDATLPPSNNPKKEGDNHLRLIKAALQNTFAGFDGQVLVRGTEAQGSTVNEYIVTVTGDTAPTSLQNNMIVFFKADHTNTGAVTLGVNAITPIPVLDIDGDALVGDELVDGRLAGVIYDEGSTSWVLITPNDRTSRNGDTIASLIILGALTVGGMATLGSLAVTGAATGTTPTAGDNTTKFATTAFVVAAVLGASVTIPGQTGKGGLQITTDGSSANWGIGAAEALAMIPLGIV